MDWKKVDHLIEDRIKPWGAAAICLGLIYMIEGEAVSTTAMFAALAAFYLGWKLRAMHYPARDDEDRS